MSRTAGWIVVALTGTCTQSARANESSPAAEIVLVGEDATCASVKDVVTELLFRDGMVVTWAQQKHFQPCPASRAA